MSKPKRLKEQKQDNSLHVEQREKIKDEVYIKEKFKLNEKQQAIISAGLDKTTRLLVIDSPAGCSKTYLSTLIGLKLLNLKRVPEIVYVRTLVQSKDGATGFLAGDLKEKTAWANEPFFSKLDELLTKPDLDKLNKENRLKTLPSSMMRGLNLCSCVIFDEAQCGMFSTIETVLTRMTEHSLVILCGDSSGSQNDLGAKSGFKKICDIFGDQESKENGVVYFKLNEDDIVRSKFVKFVIKKLRKYNENINDYIPSQSIQNKLT